MRAEDQPAPGRSDDIEAFRTRNMRRKVLSAIGLLALPAIVAALIGEAAQSDPVADAQEPASAVALPAPPESAPSSRPARAAEKGAQRAGSRKKIDALATLAELDPIGPRVAVNAAPPEQVARSLASQKRGAVQLCYERALKRNPRLRGQVTVEVDVAPPRQIEAVRVNDSLNTPSFSRCVMTAMRSARLPMVGEEMSIELPFKLRSPQL